MGLITTYVLGNLLLVDLSSWPKLKTEAEEMVEEMSEFQREQFDSWSRENLHDIESKNLSLQTSSQESSKLCLQKLVQLKLLIPMV
jgi:hypothetical protein